MNERVEIPVMILFKVGVEGRSSRLDAATSILTMAHRLPHIRPYRYYFSNNIILRYIIKSLPSFRII